MKKNNQKAKFFSASAVLVSLAILSGCASAPQGTSSVANTPSNPEETSSMGTILLSVNPEIEIEYDDRGLVLEVEGKNEDGKKVVGNYSGFSGKECQTVVEELVDEIYEEGYFDSTIDGHTKNIVVKLEKGSQYPDESFLEEVAQGVRTAVESHKLSSSALTVDEDDYADNGYIGLEKAKELVLAQLGLTEADFTEKDYELDDGVYELEFTAKGVEYEFEVNAVTGKIMKADYEHNDDWDDAPNTGSTQKISLEKAKEIALNKAGVKASDVTRWEKAELDDGVYDIEFKAGGKEYDVEVHATSGKVLEYDHEWDDDRSNSSSTSSSTSTGSTQKITLEKAKEIALAKAGIKASAVTRWEKAELDDGVYDIEFKAGGKEYDVEVHATSGKVLEYDHEWDDDRSNSSSVSSSTNTSSKKISLEKAKEIALAKAGVKASAVTRWEKAELDDGVYDIEFKAGGKEYDVEVHATSGKVLEYDHEWDDDRYDDDRDDHDDDDRDDDHDDDNDDDRDDD